MRQATDTRAPGIHTKQPSSLLCPRSCLLGPPEQCLAMPWRQAMMYGPSLPDFHGRQGPSFMTSAGRAEPSNEAAQGLSGEAE